MICYPFLTKKHHFPILICCYLEPPYNRSIFFFLQSLLNPKRFFFAVSEPPASVLLLPRRKPGPSRICLKFFRDFLCSEIPPANFQLMPGTSLTLTSTLIFFFIVNAHILDWIQDGETIREPPLDLQDALPQLDRIVDLWA